MADKPIQTKAGRPKTLREPGSSLTVWLGQSEHDRLIRMAEKRSMSVSTLVRRLLVLRLPQT